MNSEFSEPGADGKLFESIGIYSLFDARHLMAAFARAHIKFHADFDDGVQLHGRTQYGNGGRYARASLKVDPARMDEVREIQAELFGDCAATPISQEIGASVVEPAECLSCGATIPAGVTHCPKCGWTYET